MPPLLSLPAKTYLLRYFGFLYYVVCKSTGIAASHGAAWRLGTVAYAGWPLGQTARKNRKQWDRGSWLRPSKSLLFIVAGVAKSFFQAMDAHQRSPDQSWSTSTGLGTHSRLNLLS